MDLRPWLRKGANALVVEANSFGAKNFEAMPSVGWMTAATFGYAHYQVDDVGYINLVLGCINEMVDQEACDPS